MYDEVGIYLFVSIKLLFYPSGITPSTPLKNGIGLDNSYNFHIVSMEQEADHRTLVIYLSVSHCNDTRLF